MKLLLFAVLILPVSALAEGGLPNTPYIYVEGNGEIKKPADIVTIRFDLVARAPDQQKANQQVQLNAKKIFALLNERKIAENDVIAENLQSQPEFEQGEEYSSRRGKLIGYKVTRSFRVRVRDIVVFPKLADEVINIQGVEFSGIDGELANEKEIKPEVWQKALADARDQAEKTLKPIGMKIDSVFAVSPVNFRSIQDRLLGLAQTDLVQRYEAPPGPEYRLAPIIVSQSVHVIYLISPAK